MARFSSLRTWHEDEPPPIVAVEVVSENTPRKDYVVVPEKYAASGVGELWIKEAELARLAELEAEIARIKRP